MSDQWTRHYEGLVDSQEAVELIPLMGVRVIVGVDRDGADQFHVTVDGETDNIRAVFMLDMAADMFRDMVRKSFVAVVSKVDGDA